MSVDIDIFIEIDERGKRFRERDGIWLAAEGAFFLPPDYRVMSAIAEHDAFVESPVIPPRGLPKLISPDLLELLYLAVIEDGAQPENGRLCALKSEAKGWVESGESHYFSIDGCDDTRLVFDPKYYSPGWLHFRELREALAVRGLSTSDLGPHYRAFLATMRAWDSEFGAENIRCVFVLED